MSDFSKEPTGTTAGDVFQVPDNTGGGEALAEADRHANDNDNSSSAEGNASDQGSDEEPADGRSLLDRLPPSQAGDSGSASDPMPDIAGNPVANPNGAV